MQRSKFRTYMVLRLRKFMLNDFQQASCAQQFDSQTPLTDKPSLARVTLQQKT
jgi:hypothetical protein